MIRAFSQSLTRWPAYLSDRHSVRGSAGCYFHHPWGLTRGDGDHDDLEALGISRNAVRRALASDSPPTYSRPPMGSVVDVVEPQIRELLRSTPTMPATVIAERIGWDHGLAVLKDRVRVLRPFTCHRIRPHAPSTTRGTWSSATLWFPPASIPLGAEQAGRRRCW